VLDRAFLTCVESTPRTRSMQAFVQIAGTASNLSKKKHKSSIAFVALFVLLLPVLMPYGFVCSIIRERRRIRDAKRSTCKNCGVLLGRTSLERSNEYWREYGCRSQRIYPSIRINLIRSNWAICVECGTAHTYDERTGEFNLTDLRPLPLEQTRT
jgi:hypothetical protein